MAGLARAPAHSRLRGGDRRRQSQDGLRAARLYALRPIQFTGNVSYSLYLWHWPLIVLVPYVSGNHLGRLDKLTIIVVSFALAAASKRFVEDPFRRPRWGRPVLKPFAVAVAGMTVVVTATALQVAEVHHHDGQARAAVERQLAGDGPCFGAPALVAGPQKCPPVTQGALTPDPAAARNDQTPGFPHQPGVKNCFAMGPRVPPGELQLRTRGRRGADRTGRQLARLPVRVRPGPDRRGPRLAIDDLRRGDVHAERRHAASAPVAGDSAGCTRWVHWADEHIARGGFDLVITAARLQVGLSTLSFSPTPQQYANGYVSALRKLRSTGEADPGDPRLAQPAIVDSGLPRGAHVGLHRV